jgi:protein SCO1
MNQRTFYFNTSVAFPISVFILILAILFILSKPNPIGSQIHHDRVAIVLPAPKPILTFHLIRQNKHAFTKNDLKNHWTLLFFGLAKGNGIHATELSLLNRFYNTVEPIYPPLQIVFISIDPRHDTLNNIKDFITSFNKNFIGVTGSPLELKKLQKQLRISTGHYPIHPANTLALVNPNAELQAYLPANAKSDEMRLAFKEIVRRYQISSL